MLFTLVSSQELISPCPRIFKYEARNANEPDKWYGQATFIAESDLAGVWIKVFLDKPSLQLGVSVTFILFSHSYLAKKSIVCRCTVCVIVIGTEIYIIVLYCFEGYLSYTQA